MQHPSHSPTHGLRTPGEEIAFTARPKINSHSQIFRYGRSIFCLPHRPKFSDFFNLCLHWVSVVCVRNHLRACCLVPVPPLCSLQRPKLYKKRLQSTLANTKKLLKLGSKGRLLPVRLLAHCPSAASTALVASVRFRPRMDNK